MHGGSSWFESNIQVNSLATCRFIKSDEPEAGIIYGGMAERLKAADLKSVDVKASVGSNPTSSATWCSIVC